MSSFPARFARLACALALAGLVGAPALAQWVQFIDESSTRLSSAAGVGLGDVEEKDYAWGDVDHDGDIDLVVVRKQPFTTPGKKENVLFINENGVLTDRTLEFATASDVAGDMGFKTPTNDRDVQLVDVDQDGWLDIVTAVTISDADPKHIGHPRIYLNQRCTAPCAGTADWLGFRYEEARIPTMLSWSGQSGFNPRFCSVAVGDLTGDGYPELWFGDYDSSGVGGGSPQPAGADYNDRLLVNQGAANPGFFIDATQGGGSRFSGVIQIPGSSSQAFPVSAFGAAGAIRDINGDGKLDIVKQTSLNNPLYVGVAYNDPANEGFFDDFEVVTQQSPYFVSVGDLNNDNKLDLVVTDDGDDRYLLNTGNGTDGRANFSSTDFSFAHSGSGSAASDDGFGSNSLIVDLDNDGWNDVLIADVDVDIGPAGGRRTHIYRNLGGSVGGPVTLQEQTTGSDCETFQGNPATCVVASIPSDKLEGTHDIAVFDINGDGWKDMVVGRYVGTEVYINLPPLGLSFAYPQGLPAFVAPGQPETFTVQLTPFGGASITPGSVQMLVSVAGGPFTPVVASDMGGGLYEVALPAASCGDSYRFYVTAHVDQGFDFADPPNAPTSTHSAVAAVGTTTLLADSFEGDVSGWTVVDDPSLVTGSWERADPNATLFAGAPAAPEDDADPAPGKVNAFVTENGAPGGPADAADVDGGPTDLISPPIDLAGSDATIAYWRWVFSSGNDGLIVSVSNDGTNWVTVETVSLPGHNRWERTTFKVGDFVTPSATVQVRFRIADQPDNSVTEAAIDLFTVEQFVCTPCLGDPDCDDGVFCNGAETCDAGICVAGADPCPGEVCDESGEVCVECLGNGDCDDGLFCNGNETCSGNVCLPGTDPCPGQQCGELADTCVNCLGNADCDDGLFCNGAETCASGNCFNGPSPCPGQLCAEQQDVCVGSIELQPKLGQPISGLTANQLLRFQKGAIQFDRNFSELEGLGPAFNQDSCGSCHNTPLGGSGTIMVTRFGEVDGLGSFDPLAALGGSLLQSNAISEECSEIIPPEANVAANRITPSTLGFGLVQAIPDADIQDLADNPPPGVSGETHIVAVLESPGVTKVGRFGWKSQVATVLSFSADAALNEMGITNRLLTDDVPPNGDLNLLAQCDNVADPEDHPDLLGVDFISRVTDFQRFLAPPPQTPREGMTGEVLFNSTGCTACHVSSFTTSNSLALEPALRSKPVKAYSDFLLHDMGSAADQIAQGDADPSELRTPPLWGVRARDRLWHDGRVGGGSFTDRIVAALALHDDPFSEAQASAQAFAALDAADQAALIQFLDSLGRAEFDFDGDNDVDSADWQMFVACSSGPGNFYTPDETCAIADVDQDGDVDDDDYLSFLGASDGFPAGEIPSSSLLMSREPDGQVTLSWGPSCLSGDVDYAVYVGVLGDFTSHVPELCQTAGQTTATFPAADDTYFLVVPQNGTREGSYGTGVGGAARPRSIAACLPQVVGACE